MSIMAVGSIRWLKFTSAQHGATNVFGKGFYNVRGYEVSSGVPDQPLELKQMVDGAYNRAIGALSIDEEADIGVGIESAVLRARSNLVTVAGIWVVDRNGVETYGATDQVNLGVAAVGVEAGLEVSQALAVIFGDEAIADRDCIKLLSSDGHNASSFFIRGITNAMQAYKDATSM